MKRVVAFFFIDRAQMAVVALMAVVIVTHPRLPWWPGIVILGLVGCVVSVLLARVDPKGFGREFKDES